MDPWSNDPDSLLSEALIVWTGYGRSTWPDLDDERVMRRFGASKAAELLPQLRELGLDVFEPDRWVEPNPDVYSCRDTQGPSVRRPHLTDGALRALLWCRASRAEAPGNL